MFNENSFIRQVDSANRVILPQEYLRKIGIKASDFVKITVEADKIVIEAASPQVN